MTDAHISDRNRNGGRMIKVSKYLLAGGITCFVFLTGRWYGIATERREQRLLTDRELGSVCLGALNAMVDTNENARNTYRKLLDANLRAYSIAVAKRLCERGRYPENDVTLNFLTATRSFYRIHGGYVEDRYLPMTAKEHDALLQKAIGFEISPSDKSNHQ